MREQRVILREVPSGRIELVFNGVCTTLQFNCSCVDAWEMCQAMCCRLRTNFNVILRPEEIGKFESKPMSHNPHLRVLPSRGDGSCLYLERDGVKCTVHEYGKPWACTKFHCSPQGAPGDADVTWREGGWLLSPMKVHEVVDDQGTVVDWQEIYAKNLKVAG